MKKSITFLMVIIVLLSCCSCGTNSELPAEQTQASELTTEESTTEDATSEEASEETSEESTKEDESSLSSEGSAFQMISATANSEERAISFDEANILSFELSSRDDGSFWDIIAKFTCTNTADVPIDYFSVDFVYKDNNGNILSKDGRYHDCQLLAGKSAYIFSYSNLDEGFEKSDVGSIEVTSYDYYIGSTRYDIDLENRTVKPSKKTIHADAPFEEVNIISFGYQDVGLNSIGSYEVDVQATNGGDKNIIYISFKMGFFDDEGNFLDSDGRFNDNNVAPGTFVQMRSFMTRDEFSSQVGAFGIYSYKYRLSEDDEYGFNYYEVNLQTKEISGWHRDS